MIRLILGNLFGFMSCVLCASSTFCKTTKKMIVVQCTDCACGMISNIILQGYSGAIVQGINLIRNYLVYKDKVTIKLGYIIMVITVLAGLMLNNRGIIGLLPMVASVEYALVILRPVKPNTLRKALTINNLIWTVYALAIQDYAGGIMTLIIAVISTINTKRNKNTEQE